jgi:hypothetical protein
VTTPATRRSARPGPAPTRLAWALCVLSVTLAVAAVALATVNGENLVDLVEAHQAIGILDALVLSVVGALIVARDRRHLLAWLLLVEASSWPSSISPPSTRPWPSASPRGTCRCPAGTWPAGWPAGPTCPAS